MYRPLLALFAFTFTISNLFAAVDASWKPVDPQLLTSKTPKIDRDADAEAIFWETWIEDYTQGGYAHHRQDNYIRIKLYNARAVEKWGDVKIEYPIYSNSSLTDFKGRVIKADGTIIEVKGGQVKDVTIFKTGKLKLRAKSFAFPSLEPGDVIEYRYAEVFPGYLRYIHLPMQMEIPAWEITQNVRPLMHPGFSQSMRSYPFNFTPKNWEPVLGVAGRNGFVRMQIQDIPAYVREPNMPSTDDSKGWLLIYYTENGQQNPEKFWPSQARKLNDELRKDVKINSEIKALTASLTGKLTSPVEKANALAEYCQTNIRNVSYQANGLKAQDRDEFFKSTLKEVYTSADTLKNKIGRPRDIRMLFFALAESAGLAPAFIASSSTTGPMFRKDLLDPYFIRKSIAVAIKDGETMRYYDPGIPYLPPGVLDYDMQGQPALICDAKNPKLDMLNFTPPELSAIRRTANLKMSDTGALSGTVQLVYTGHFAVEEKRENDDKSPADRETAIRKQLEAQYPGAQISEIKVENADQATGAYSVAYRVDVENYGQRAGKRMFVVPGYFQFSKTPVFSASTRKHAIVYDHAFTEVDSVTMEIPAGFVLDAADMPGKIQLGHVGEYAFTASYAKENRMLRANRTLVWGKDGALWFEPKTYPAIKQAWDQLHKADTHQLTFKVE